MHYSRRRYQGQRSVVAAWARSPPQPTDDALNISMNLSVLTKFWELYLAGVVGVPSQLSVIAVDVHGLCTPPAIEKSRAHGCKVVTRTVSCRSWVQWECVCAAKLTVVNSNGVHWNPVPRDRNVHSGVGRGSKYARSNVPKSSEVGGSATFRRLVRRHDLLPYLPRVGD